MKIIGTIQVHDGIIDLKKIWNQVSIGHNHIDISLIILKIEKKRLENNVEVLEWDKNISKEHVVQHCNSYASVFSRKTIL